MPQYRCPTCGHQYVSSIDSKCPKCGQDGWTLSEQEKIEITSHEAGRILDRLRDQSAHGEYWETLETEIDKKYFLLYEVLDENEEWIESFEEFDTDGERGNRLIVIRQYFGYYFRNVRTIEGISKKLDLEWKEVSR